MTTNVTANVMPRLAVRVMPRARQFRVRATFHEGPASFTWMNTAPLSLRLVNECILPGLRAMAHAVGWTCEVRCGDRPLAPEELVTGEIGERVRVKPPLYRF